MKIERIIAINFGALSERDVEIGHATLVVGKNGAGKSTLQDLIQIVLAGNDGSMINLNPAQNADDRKQKRKITKRSLAAYAVGMTDDGPGRPLGALCVIGLVFQPDEDEDAELLTALWMAEVIPDQPGLANRQNFRIKQEYGALVRASLRSVDILQVDEFKNWRVPALATICDQLMANYPRGKVRAQVSKRNYVSLLHEWMTGGSMDSEREAERATKTFIQSIALKDISDVDAVVRERVLDDMDVSSDVQQTAETLRELELLQAEADRLAHMNTILERAEVSGLAILERIRSSHISHLALAMRKRAKKSHDHQVVVSALADCHIRLVKAQQAEAALASAVQTLEIEYQDATLIGSKVPGIQERQSLLAEGRELQNYRERVVAGIRGGIAGDWVGTVAAAVELLPSAKFNAIHEAWIVVRPHAEALATASAALRSFVGQQFKRGEADMDSASLQELALEHDTHLEILRDGDGGSLAVLKAAAFNEVSGLGALRTALEESLEEARRQLETLDRGGAPVHSAIEDVCARLAQALPPAAKPRLLCNHVSPKAGTPWQGAIEGLIGGGRFVILVEPAYEGQAHALLRDWTPRLNRNERGGGAGPQPVIAQSRRAREEAQRRKPVSSSIVEELEFDDELARDHVIAKYGSTQKVFDAKVLDNIASGLMVDGRLSKSYGRRIAHFGMEACVFGQESRRAQRAALETRRHRESRELDEVRSQHEAIRRLATFEADRSGQAILDQAIELERLEEKRAEFARRQEALDGSTPEADKALERIRQKKELLDNARGHATAAAAEKQKLDYEHTSSLSARAKAEGEMAEASQHESQYRVRLEYAQDAVSPLADPGSWEAEAQDLSTRPVDSVESLDVVAGDIAQKFQRIQQDLDSYMECARDGEGVERVETVENSAVWSRMNGIVQCVRSVERRKVWLQESSLRQNAEEIGNTKRKFASVLTDTLVQKILSRTKQIQFVIDTLNRPLLDLDFGTHRRYEIIRELKPEFSEYLNFFMAVKEKSQNLSPEDQWFGSDVFTPQEHAIREKIKRDLLNSHSEAGRRSLERISNAANYYEYDLKFETAAGNQVLYSQWGTGSGGESGTPPYILCGMLVANAFGWFKGKGPRMRVLMLDEAFKVHDLERSNRVIEYLRRMGFQLIIAAQMDKASSILPNFTTTISMARLSANIGGAKSWISQVHVIGLNRDPLRALWQERRREVAAAAEAEFRRLHPPPQDELVLEGQE